jgi:hypothetical protein
LVAHADNGRTRPAKVSLGFLKQNGMKKHITRRTNLIWHRLISVSSATLSNSEQDTNSLIGVRFLTQSKHPDGS